MAVIQFTALEAVFDANARPFLNAAARTSRAATRLGRTIASKTIRVMKRLAGVTKSLAKSLLRLTKRLALVGAAAIATAGLLAKLAAGVKDIDNKFKVVFRGVEDDILPTLEELNEKLLLPISGLQKMASTLQDTLFPLTQNRELSAKLSAQLVKLALDLSSFNDVPIEETLNSLQSALVGQTRAVLRYGIVMTQSALAAEALAIGIDKGLDEMTEQEKVLVRVNLLMKGSSDALGDFERTAFEGTNTFRLLTMNLKDFGAALGTIFLPGAEAFNVTMARMLAKASTAIRQNFEDWKGFSEGFASFETRLFTTLGDILGSQFKADQIEEMWKRFKNAAGEAWTWITEQAAKVWDFLDVRMEKIIAFWNRMAAEAVKSLQTIANTIAAEMDQLELRFAQIKAIFDWAAIKEDFRQGVRDLAAIAIKEIATLPLLPVKFFMRALEQSFEQRQPVQLLPESLRTLGITPTRPAAAPAPQTNININVEADPREVAERIAALLRRQGDELGLGAVSVERAFA